MFAVPPSFHDAKFPQNFDFGSSKFPGIKGKLSSARAYRTLKLAFAQQHAVREELRFFKLEMAEESKAAKAHKTPNWWLYWLYEKLSDFGFSVNRPLLLFALTTIVSVGLYACQADLALCRPWSPTCNATAPLLQFGLAHALPGFEKLAEPAAIKLFGDAAGKGVADLGLFTVITLFAQKTVSLLSLFLIGLALRNLFKMK